VTGMNVTAQRHRRFFNLHHSDHTYPAMLARVSAVRRIPQFVVIARRNTSSVKEGSVAQSRGFRYVVVAGDVHHLTNTLCAPQ
jgi:hypothetical protein